MDVQNLKFDYKPPSNKRNVPVLVIGAGPVGLTTAIDLAMNGVEVILIDDDDTLSNGSRAICFAKRSLEIFDRLGVGDKMLAKGVTWNVGKVFYQENLLYSFDLLPEKHQKFPAFINLQQYYVEAFLLERAKEFPNLDIRFKHKLVGLTTDGVAEIETPDGTYTLTANYVVAADGGKSAARRLLGLESKGRSFQDKFLIADIKMEADFPPERWFWFDPPFHQNQSVLLHKQPDNVWRIDFQLGINADANEARKEENVLPLLKKLLGDAAKFTLEWVSVYSFLCTRMAKFVHGKVIFAGDSAHGVSPFGARGANSGIQDAENIAWKLRAVLNGASPDLIQSYDSERSFAADENILNSTRSTDFLTPKNEASKVFRNAALTLAKTHSFARRIVNSGRLSVPTVYQGEQDGWDCPQKLYAPLLDAPYKGGWLLNHVGNAYKALYYGKNPPKLPLETLIITKKDAIIIERLGLEEGTLYLIRPDQHVAKRFKNYQGEALNAHYHA